MVKIATKLGGSVSSSFVSISGTVNEAIVLSFTLQDADMFSSATTPVNDITNSSNNTIFVFIVVKPPFGFFKEINVKQFFCQ